MPPTTHRRPNPLTAFLGRPALSFEAETFAMLPPLDQLSGKLKLKRADGTTTTLTTFTCTWAAGTDKADNLSWTKSRDGGWTCPKFPGEHFAGEFVRAMPDLVCIAVGEPEVLGIERPADDALRALLPRSPLPLSVVVNVDAVPVAPMEPLLEPRVIDLPPRAARISAADMREAQEIVGRLREWCGRTGADLSLLVDGNRATVMFIGDAKPDLVDAVQVGGHRQHTDAAGTVTIWRAS